MTATKKSCLLSGPALPGELRTAASRPELLCARKHRTGVLAVIGGGEVALILDAPVPVGADGAGRQSADLQ